MAYKIKRISFVALILIFAGIIGIVGSGQTPPKIIGTVVNDGPSPVGSSLTFAGSCEGENSYLLVCRESTICNQNSNPFDVVCSSSPSSEAQKTCTITTRIDQQGSHDNDIATCCSNEGCDTETVNVQPWSVSEGQQPESSNTINLLEQAASQASQIQQSQSIQLDFESGSRIVKPILNDGPVEEGSSITFAGTCLGSNSKMVVCRRNVACSDNTPPEDVLCESGLSDIQQKACTYQSTVSDLGVNDFSIAACCTGDSCSSIAEQTEPWIVNKKDIVSPILPSAEVDTFDINEGEVIQGLAEMGKSVKWTKRIKKDRASEKTIVKIPGQSTDIKVKKIIDTFREDIPQEKLEISQITDGSEKKKEITINEPADYIELEFTTPSPLINEKEEKRRKIIEISSDTHYQNISAQTTIPETRQERVKLYHIVNDSRVLVSDIKYLDINNNGLIDGLEWIVPHLSNQTYEIIIEIVKAEHLNSTYGFISDIYNETKAKDGVWSEKIYYGEYLRATFETNLTSNNDITIYVRNNQSLNTTVGVYARDSSFILAEFPIIEEAKYYTIYLSNLSGTQDTFDLKIMNNQNDSGAYLEFDHVIDPQSNLVVNDCFISDGASDSTCTTAISADGGSSQAIAKGAHVDAPFNTLSADSVTGATLYFDTSGTLSGTYSVFLTATRDGTVICSADPAAETSTETRKNVDCSSITTTQLSNGVWFRLNNDDGAQPESITLDYTFLQVNFTANTAPSLSSASLNVTNTTLFVTSNFINSSVTVSDADAGDKINLTAVLFVSGVVNRTVQLQHNYIDSGVASYIWNYTNITRGQNITVQFNGSDGKGASNYLNTTFITVNATAPVLSGPQLNVTNATFFPNSDTINSSVDLVDIDTVDRVNLTAVLFVNDIVNSTLQLTNNYQNGTNVSIVFNNTNVTASQEVKVQFNASDGEGKSNYVNTTTVTVQTMANEAPSLASAGLNVTNITLLASADTINVSVVVSDLDAGDKINVTGVFFVNNDVNITLLNMSNNYVDGDTASIVVNTTNVTKGQVINIQFNATDGKDSSNYINTSKITVNNTGPAIGNITFHADSNPVTVTEDGFETLTFYFLAHDLDGELNNNSARANITNVNSTDISSNISCSNVSSPGPNTINYSCTVDVWYFNLPGTWNVTVQVNDTAASGLHQANQTQNTTWNFTVQDTTAMSVNSQITFPEITQGGDNYTSTEDIRINNTGNHNTTGSAGSTISVTVYNLTGASDTSYNFTPSNFTISNNTGGTPPVECNTNQFGGGANRTIDGVETVIANASLSSGNRSIAGQGNETLYVCLYDAPTGLLAQDYIANGTRSWIITVN